MVSFLFHFILLGWAAKYEQVAQLRLSVSLRQVKWFCVAANLIFSPELAEDIVRVDAVQLHNAFWPAYVSLTQKSGH